MPRAMTYLSKAHDLLCEINDTIGWIMYRGPGHLSHIGMGREDFYEIQAMRLKAVQRRYLLELKRQNILDARKVGNRLEVRLTDKGFLVLIRDAVRKFQNKKLGRERCLIIYDVPETERSRRAMLNQFLRECGIKLIQKSVYECPAEMAPLLLEFVRREKLNPWIQIFRGEMLTKVHKK